MDASFRVNKSQHKTVNEWMCVLAGTRHYNKIVGSKVVDPMIYYCHACIGLCFVVIFIATKIGETVNGWFSRAERDRGFHRGQSLGPHVPVSGLFAYWWLSVSITKWQKPNSLSRIIRACRGRAIGDHPWWKCHLDTRAVHLVLILLR